MSDRTTGIMLSGRPTGHRTGHARCPHRRPSRKRHHVNHLRNRTCCPDNGGHIGLADRTDKGGLFRDPLSGVRLSVRR